ncbi:hypothetical protein M407DRAFT_245851 [Tulasnella calospora MUT 4182]|uniref:Uncharacterized protein n=1 Tax=Tulasnella calospora MUT 4182 TaxID=1051891 RepID=A0A0C3Q8Z1_9AGAM|nr:hypothetical protein M407DRAFT_245851 [Tulasnella calospora MUT 4182]
MSRQGSDLRDMRSAGPLPNIPAEKRGVTQPLKLKSFTRDSNYRRQGRISSQSYHLSTGPSSPALDP